MPVKTIEVTNIFDLIDLVRERPSMYLGTPTITGMNLFLLGYDMGIQLHKVKHSPYSPPFYFFHDWVNRYYKYGHSSMGWSSIILENENRDEESALERFFALYDSFKKIRVKSVWVAEILSGEKHYVQLVEFSHGLGVAEYYLDGNGNKIGVRCREMYTDIEEVKEQKYRNNSSSINWVQLEVKVPELWSKVF